MIKIILNILIFLSASICGNTNFETGWNYTQTALQGFYIIESINIDGGATNGYDDSPSECSANPYSCDVIGSFIIRDETLEGEDMNSDGVVNILDIIIIVNLIVG